MNKFVLFLTLISMRAHASGCLGGGWQTISTEQLSPSEIRTDYYGEPIAEVKVWPDHGGFVTWSNLGTLNQKLIFYSGSFDLQKIDLVELLTRLKGLPPVFKAATRKIIESNPYYDDCSDIPENTIKTTLHYEFEVQLSNGEEQKFQSDVTNFDPPLSRN